MRLARHWLWVAMVAMVATFASGCGGSSSPTIPPTERTLPAPISTAVPKPAAHLRILFMGNSHTSVHDVPGSVARLIGSAQPDLALQVATAPGNMFLSERLTDDTTLRLLRDAPWDVVVLQAQKYSSSGRVTYSTSEAQELIAMVRTAGAVPVLFPEWSRRDVPETDRIYDLHTSLAKAAPACVAPIPQAFDLALERDRSLVLHEADGNHSSSAGAFLAALVLFATITSSEPDDVGAVEGEVSPDVQATLRAAATDAVRSTPPRQWCPVDRGKP